MVIIFSAATFLSPAQGCIAEKSSSLLSFRPQGEIFLRSLTSVRDDNMIFRNLRRIARSDGTHFLCARLLLPQATSCGRVRNSRVESKSQCYARRVWARDLVDFPKQ